MHYCFKLKSIPGNKPVLSNEGKSGMWFWWGSN